MDGDLLPALAELESSLRDKAEQLEDVVKPGRTHLQDATPIRVGQVFRGYAAQVARSRHQLAAAQETMLALPIGGTAVGTGVNTHPEFARGVADALSRRSGLAFAESDDHLAAQATADAFVVAMSALKQTALALAKIANDIRFLSSGPRGGLGELVLPAVQPGSSIMPGKVNPVIAESLIQVSAWVVGADASVSWAASMLSNFELSAAQPLIALQLLESIRLLAAGSRNFDERAVLALEADRERCEELVERSLALGTSLAPRIGYDAASALVKRAHETGASIREVARSSGEIPEEEVDRLLDARAMTEPG